MNQCEQINRDFDLLIERRRDADIITPASLATILQKKYTHRQKLPPEIEYSSLEYLKQMARDRLRRSYETDSADNPAYVDQGELFSGHLQERYPIPRKRGEEPAYKRRELLTADERAWNVNTMRRKSGALALHADALEAEGIGHASAA